ncbi:MAG: GNAT family N-acetyltransferase [Pseudomonadota bacterium]
MMQYSQQPLEPVDTDTSGAQIEFLAVGDARTRDAARCLLTEYLEWIGHAASSNYGLDFEIGAMVESDLADPDKFFPPLGRFYVVRHGGEFIGVGCLKQLTPTIGEVQRMYVQPRARGLGVGRLLVERLLADARAIGYTAVRLESLKVLEAAHALYRSVGFKEIAPYAENSMKDYQSAEKLDTYRSSALFMELRL